MKDKEKQIWKNCKHHKADMDGVYCGINKGAGYNHCVLPHRTSHCKYFESNNEEKQIEEMAKLIDDRLIEARGYLGSMNKGEGYWIAQKLIEHYQPKIPKDSVVLSREEYERLKNLSNLVPELSLENLRLKEEQKEMQKAIAKDNSVNWLLKQDRRITEKRVSKETAEKYKGFIRELLTNGDDSITTYYGDVKYRLIREDDLQELAKQCGVEIKES